VRWWQRFAVGQRSLACRLSRSIPVKDFPEPSTAILQACSLLLAWGVWPGQQILLKEGSQGLNRGLIDGSEEATERAAIRQFIPSKQSHKRGSEGQKALVE